MLRMRGVPTRVIFWDKDFDKGLKSYIQDSRSRNTIENSGILRMDYQDYRIVYKNKENKKRNIRIFMGMLEIN